MNKRKGESPKPMRRSTPDKTPQRFYTPFQELDQLFGRTFSLGRTKHPAKLDPFSEKAVICPPRIKGEPDEDSLFKSAMADVSPLRTGPGNKVPNRPAYKECPRFLAREEIE